MSKKGIRAVELLANIKANIVAFFSISMFVCLGVALFTGIQWGAVALRDAANDAIARGNMHDVEIQYPYGITDSDLDQIRKIDDVSDLECGYSTFVVMAQGATSYTIKVQSITERIDVPTRVEGTMPARDDEIALLGFWAKGKGISIGDTVHFRHQEAASGAADGLNMLEQDTFVVTALVDMPSYLQKMSTTLGVSNIASGAIDCVGFVRKEVFDSTKFKDGYSNVYLRCNSVAGVGTFTDEYRDRLAPTIDSLTSLGGILGTNRYNKIHGDAQEELDQNEQRLRDGEEQLNDANAQTAEGEKTLEDGKRQLAEGQRTLEAGREELAAQQLSGTEELAEAYSKLVEGQATYNAGLEAYNTAIDTYNSLSAALDENRGSYDMLVELINDEELFNTLDTLVADVQGALDDYHAADEGAKDDAWAAVVDAYNKLKDSYNDLKGETGSANGTLGGFSGFGFLSSLGSLPDIPSDVNPNSIAAELEKIVDAYYTVRSGLDDLANQSITVSGHTISFTDIPGGLEEVADELEEKRGQLDDAEAELKDGWAEYDAGKALYDSGVAEGQDKVAAGARELEEKQNEAQEGARKLEEARREIASKTKELEDGKIKLDDAKRLLANMIEYEWVVLPRLDSGGIQGISTVSAMMENVRWAMASLFIIVGLFVCYSAISRLVHEQMVQLGTKKALGFREGEVTSHYLWFAGISVVLGSLLSIALSILLVQGIMNPTAASNFCVEAYGPYFWPVDLLVVGGLELLLILASTWFAIHGVLKLNAIDLLKGESTASVKQHFYERTRLWSKMSLYSQTIVNNCVNDRRRVVGTLIGVVGCTALIVTAVTLAGNVGDSLTRHYDEVYHFDSIAFLDGKGDEPAKSVAMALYDHGIASTEAFERMLQVRKTDGTRAVANLVVPTNEESFEKFYSVVSTNGGPADLARNGLWVSAGYGSHMHLKEGDEITLTENTGKTHTFRVAGFFDYYLLRQEFVISKQGYTEAFGEEPQTNLLLVNTDGVGVDAAREYLVGTKGYSSLADDKATASYAYTEITRILRTVVLIYLLLSALMAIVVLLNLDTMFVDEKKRELIVLMINGFSTKDAKAYIYRDSIALTVIGILLGVVVGAIMGAITVGALEPANGYFLKGLNGTAAIVGIVGAAVFSIGVLLFALRRIPRFDLTDINRF